MCGVAGIFSTSETSISRHKVEAALGLISHRGPDDLNCESPDGMFSGGAVRLSIEAIHNGIQPITVGNITVGFNGEIFNYKQLAEEYGLGSVSATSEVRFLLDAWVKKGTELFTDLDGQFAIFIYVLCYVFLI